MEHHLRKKGCRKCKSGKEDPLSKTRMDVKLEKEKR
jgi:hypothetical protein